MSQPEQRRILATSIPGPKSQKLQVQRAAELSSGVGVTMPVFIERAGGGILVDVDGNHIIDFASGIAVTSVGASDRAVVRRIAEQAERFTHTCFLVTEYEGFSRRSRRAQPADPGDHPKRTALFTTGAEAVENAIKIARTATRRPAVIVLGHAYHGRTLLTMTMTAKNVPYKRGFRSIRSGGLPRSLAIPLPMAEWPRELRGRGAGGPTRHGDHRGRRQQRRRDHCGADPG